MNEKLKEYFEIELSRLPKRKRNQLHAEFLQDLKGETLKFEDISSLLNEAGRKNIVIRQPFFEKIIYPILEKEISENNVRALKHLIKLEQKLLQLQRRIKIYEPSKRQLILKGLQINPDEKELLEMYETDLRNSLLFTIHEVSFGVLYGMNGADENQCDELLKILEDYREVCEKLSLDRTGLINECKFHFRAYKTFLKIQDQFEGYEDFLKNNSKMQ